MACPAPIDVLLVHFAETPFCHYVLQWDYPFPKPLRFQWEKWVAEEAGKPLVKEGRAHSVRAVPPFPLVEIGWHDPGAVVMCRVRALCEDCTWSDWVWSTPPVFNLGPTPEIHSFTWKRVITIDELNGIIVASSIRSAMDIGRAGAEWTRKWAERMSHMRELVTELRAAGKLKEAASVAKDLRYIEKSGPLGYLKWCYYGGRVESVPPAWWPKAVAGALAILAIYAWSGELSGVVLRMKESVQTVAWWEVELKRLAADGTSDMTTSGLYPAFMGTSKIVIDIKGRGQYVFAQVRVRSHFADCRYSDWVTSDVIRL